MWTIKCDGRVMGRLRSVERAVIEMSRMIREIGEESDKWAWMKKEYQGRWSLHRE